MDEFEFVKKVSYQFVFDKKMKSASEELATA